MTRLAARQLARIATTTAKERPRRSSWGRARIEWPSGRVREGWLRTGDAMAYTAAAVTEVAQRLAAGEGRPGAFTPGRLFGPDLAPRRRRIPGDGLRQDPACHHRMAPN